MKANGQLERQVSYYIKNAKELKKELEEEILEKVDINNEKKKKKE